MKCLKCNREIKYLKDVIFYDTIMIKVFPFIKDEMLFFFPIEKVKKCSVEYIECANCGYTFSKEDFDDLKKFIIELTKNEEKLFKKELEGL